MSHWNYFLALENDVEKLTRYIEFSEHNFGTYSIELAHLLLAISSEIDVVSKCLCNEINPQNEARNINDYRKLICEQHSKLIKEKVFINRYNLEFQPWQKWEENKNPGWWHSYNKVKHKRNEHFTEANLGNVLEAISGLFVLIFYKKKVDIYNEESPCNRDPIRELMPQPKLLRLDAGYYWYEDMST